MSPPPFLTIGLPVYNAAPFLRDCLRSIFAQTWSDWELVVVDDGSTDESLAILESVDDQRVRLVGRGLHRGLGASLNLIADSARGRYVARMDADDMMHPSRLDRQLRILLERSDLDGVGCGIVLLDRTLEPIGVKLNPAETCQPFVQTVAPVFNWPMRLSWAAPIGFATIPTMLIAMDVKTGNCYF